MRSQLAEAGLKMLPVSSALIPMTDVVHVLCPCYVCAVHKRPLSMAINQKTLLHFETERS